MPASFQVFFSSPRGFDIASTVLVACGVIYVVRRPRIRRWTILLIGVAGLLITAAAGEPMVRRRIAGIVTVMVDLSPSTRGATFRDRAALTLQIRQLLGDHPYRLLAFSDSSQPIPTAAQLPDIPVDRTVFAPPPSDAIVLFSDGRFELPPTAPPTYPVIDPALDDPRDAAVTQLTSTGTSVVATVRNDGMPRPLHWTHAIATTDGVGTGSFQQYAKPDGSGVITASIPPGDRWPENDSLTIRPAPSAMTERWWVGASVPAGWHHFEPAGLPSSASDYLRTSTIVLQNVSADLLSTEQQRRLVQYVRDLGGSVIIAGGDHAFAAGGYDGSALDSLSPLASSPPAPATHWMLLIDGSGSMAGEGGDGPSPWQIESTAVTALLPHLPPDDAVSVGSFAETLAWWTTGKPAKETQMLHLPPASAFPHGPTNLAPVLQQIIASDDGSIPAQLLVMTDAETELSNAETLGPQMVARKIHLHVLAIGHGIALPALRAIAATTGGSVVEQLDPRRWIADARLLLKNAMPVRYQHEPVTVQFTAAAPPPLLQQNPADWNRTWLRTNATLLAKTANVPMAASWQHGLGRVTAIAFAADQQTIAALAEQIATPAHDPRFSVTWEAASLSRLRVDAVDGRDYLNNAQIKLELREAEDSSAAPVTTWVPQTGPGLYELTVPASRRPQIATVTNGSQVLDRFAIAGRYAPEFDAIGNDLPSLNELAHRTGGAVIPPGSVAPIDFRWPLRSTPIAPELAFMGFVAVAAGLVLHRTRN